LRQASRQAPDRLVMAVSWSCAAGKAVPGQSRYDLDQRPRGRLERSTQKQLVEGRERRPEGRPELSRSGEVSRQDPNDCHRRTVQPHRPADGGRIAVEPSQPEVMAHHDHGRRADGIV
jgi:hypothetical protein